VYMCVHATQVVGLLGRHHEHVAGLLGFHHMHVVP
jgi:hypothetical protein